MGFMSHLRALAALAAAALLVSCGDGSTGPEPKPEPLPQPGIRVVAGPLASDTIGATPPQALVVEVRGPEGRVAPGVVVRFGAPAVPAAAQCIRVAGDCWEKPSMWLGDPAGSTFSEGGSAVVAGADGRASVRIRFGGRAGTGRIVVTVPELGMQDTIRFEIRAGAGVKAIAEPHDTAVALGAGFVARGLVVDRWGNPRAEAASVALSGGPGLRVEGRSVAPLDYGVHALIAQSPGLPGDTTRVTVVPRGTLAAVTGDRRDSLVVVDLDGANRRTIPVGQYVDGLDWMPDGSGLLASVGTFGPPRRLYVYALDGARRQFIPGDTIRDEFEPVFTANGEWVFFIGTANRIWRARRDGSGVEHVPWPGVTAGVLGPSPDGSRLVVLGWVFDRVQGELTKTVILETATGRTTPFPFEANVFRWSPSADLIAFSVHGRPGVLRTDGSGVRYLSDESTGAGSYLDISSDGRWILYLTTYFLELIEVETGRRIPLRHIPRYSEVALKP
jgi:hypothetical protein